VARLASPNWRSSSRTNLSLIASEISLFKNSLSESFNEHSAWQGPGVTAPISGSFDGKSIASLIVVILSVSDGFWPAFTFIVSHKAICNIKIAPRQRGLLNLILNQFNFIEINIVIWFGKIEASDSKNLSFKIIWLFLAVQLILMVISEHGRPGMSYHK
jgi:hypothetical protein